MKFGATMNTVDQETKDKVLNKVARHLAIHEYYDIHDLPDEVFTEKYGHWGLGQQNFVEIRFYPETNGLIQLKKLLSSDDEYFILPIDKNRRVYRDKISIVDELFSDHRQAHVIVSDIKFNWILIKTDFNKLIGMGDQMKKKIGKMIHMCFDNEKIMYSLTDSRTNTNPEDRKVNNES
jgi:hypothetical protein